MHTFPENVSLIAKCLAVLCLIGPTLCDKCDDAPQKCSRDAAVQFEESQSNVSLLYEFLTNKALKLPLSGGLEVEFRDVNDSLSVNLNAKDGAMARKMQMSMKNVMPYMIVPGLLMAGILPWVIPGIKMAVMAVSMMNQMAFNAALFGLIRSYVFDTHKEEHVVYINSGYRKKHQGHHGHR